MISIFEYAAARMQIVAINVSAWDPAVDPRGLDVLLPLLSDATWAAVASGR
ncbi:hypothetical protein [Microbacterium hydrothermale]|uniref:hypothetical protein n=1 Tax=Microbacterium hydrothermale TaxID=857427 RepID=UPI00222678C4|nr:hypothetical protein [Microbacterium hydrothermale]